MTSNWIAYVLGFVAMVCYAVLPVLAKKLQIGLTPFAMIAVTMAILCCGAAGVSYFTEKDFSLAKIDGKLWLGLVMFSLINLAGFAFYLLAITKMPIAQYQLIGLLTSIVGGLVAYVALGEKIKTQYLVGLAFMSVGLCIALRDGVK